MTPEGLRDTIRLSKRRVQSTEVHALLPYVFFEHDSAVIPERYVRYDKKTWKQFEIERITRGNTMKVYYEMLNVIGQRLRRNRKATVTITGCVSQFENGDTALSRRRVKQSVTT